LCDIPASFEERFMTVSKTMAVSIILAVLFAFSLASCVDVEVDPDPPYPIKDRNYDYDEDDTGPPPWEHPEDYPHVVITEPVEGQFVSNGELTVAGTYEGPSLKSLMLNGEEISLSDGAFSSTISITRKEAFRTIEVLAKTDDDITYIDRVSVNVGQAAVADTTETDSLLLDIETRGFDAISGLLSTMLDGTEVSSLLSETVSKDFTSKKASGVVLGNIDIILGSKDEGLEFSILASGVEIETEFLGMAITIGIDGLFGEVLAEVTVNQGALELDVVNVESGLASFTIDALLIPDGVANALGLIVELIVPPVLDALIEGPVQDLLNNLLADLNLAINIEDFVLNLAPSLATTLDERFTIGFESSVELTKQKSDFQIEGYRATDSDTPEFDSNAPSGDPFGLGLGIGDEFLNQLFYALCTTGMLDFEITDPMLKAEVASVLLFSFEQVDPGSQLIIRFKPTSSPLLYGDSESGEMMLTIPGYTGYVYVNRYEEGRWEAMTFTVDLTALADLTVNEDGSFSLRLGETDATIAIEHNAIGQANVTNANSLFEEIFASILPEILSALDNTHIELPLLAGMGIDLVDVTAFGAGQDYLGAFIDLTFPGS
jgi:glucodextranase-like protein